ncbi:MAG: sugar ABC transporter substrate-binding protein, partial [Defluviitoga tunisiensis]
MVKRKVIVVMLACLLIVSSIFSQVKLVSEVGIHTEAWKTVMNDFQEETGIKATIQQFPYSNYFD